MTKLDLFVADPTSQDVFFPDCVLSCDKKKKCCKKYKKKGYACKKCPKF